MVINAHVHSNSGIDNRTSWKFYMICFLLSIQYYYNVSPNSLFIVIDSKQDITKFEQRELRSRNIDTGL